MKYLTQNKQYKFIPVFNQLAFLFFMLAFSSIALGQTVETGKKVSEFFGNIIVMLNFASIAVVTIAVIFAGYQIAFANKRIADVAPILVGGVLIGAATQIAKMLVSTPATAT